MDIPLIPIIIGGSSSSFEIAMSYLQETRPILLLDGSGGAADFIWKGYNLIMNGKREEKQEEDVFLQVKEAAEIFSKCCSDCDFAYHDLYDSLESYSELLARLMVKHLENNQKLIHVYSVNEATYTLERTIEDIFFQLFVKGQQVGMRERDILHFVNIWNRPDIAETVVFNVENNEILQTLRGDLADPDSSLAQLFRISLMRDRVDFVRLILEHIQIDRLYKKFLNTNLKTLYVETGCIAGFLIHKLDPDKDKKEKDKDKNNEKEDMGIVKLINKAVIQILGRREMQPFTPDDEEKGIQEKDIYKHLFIWSVLMDRRELAMLFWKKEDKDFICSALYASALAKRLAENPLAEEHTDHLVSLWESHRYYEDLAYSVMTKMYWKDKSQAWQLLVAGAKRYNSNTIFEITEKFALMKFMGHAACQTKLNKIWKGHILSETSTLKVVTAAFIPILIMKIVKEEDVPSAVFDTTAQTKPNSETPPQATKTLPNWMMKIYHFYQSPLLRFCLNVLAYMVMLVMFSMFVLTDLHPIPVKSPSVMEYFVYAWAASTFVEEMRQAFGIKQVSLNLTTWFSFWTLFQIMMYSLFITSVVLRLTLSAEDFYHARMMYSITLGLFIINSMQFFLVSKRIGPKVIMIGRMMFDIIFFILIFAVFLFGFGVIYQATMFPNSQPGFKLFKEIIYMPYWQLYGELFLDNLEGKEPSTCTNDETLYRNGTIARCPEINQMNSVLLAVYMVVTHIILVNILIAMFSHTFTKVQDNNHLVWKFHRFSLIREYYDKSSLVPPFIIISHMKRVIMCIFSKCADRKANKVNMSDTTESTHLAILERESVYRHLHAPGSLKTYHAKDTEDAKNGFETRYEKKY
ncbi:transient receptor potential cation channel subfamily M member 5-like [Mytilus trossulus]|uniref:transient receptor potential cation channel subfamily M member 5-like n=1 Tax=Mytilus trossulus TaxID=6551 RepID=UPI0030043B38